MYEFWYDYVKPKYGEKATLCYADVEQRFDTSNYELNSLLPKEKNKKVIGVMKNELGGKTMKEFLGLWVKTCS